MLAGHLSLAPHLEGTNPCLMAAGCGARWKMRSPWGLERADSWDSLRGAFCALRLALPAGTRMSGCGTSAPTRGSRAPTCPSTSRRSGPSGSWCGMPRAGGPGWGPSLSLGALLTSVPAAGHLSHQGGQGGLCHRVGSCVRDPRPGLCQRCQLHVGQCRGETE